MQHYQYRLILAAFLFCLLLATRLLYPSLSPTRHLTSAMIFSVNNLANRALHFEITDPAHLRTLANEQSRWQGKSIPLPDAALPAYRLELVRMPMETQTFYLTHDLRLYNDNLTMELIPPPRTHAVLRNTVDRLLEQHFGELIPWSEADQSIPRYSIFTLMDLETGLTWRTQRRAGAHHADIQPLTPQDTAILKQVYQGEWSWARRAVIVLTQEGQRLAAAINGMPHGAGALVNDFPGHHCLHFLDSTTHSSRKTDPAHQVMVHKAAGQLHKYIQNLAPNSLQLTLLAMASQREIDVLQLGLIGSAEQKKSYASLVEQIRQITIRDSRPLPAQDGSWQCTYDLTLYFQHDSHPHHRQITITSRYIGPEGKWLTDPDFLLQLCSP